MKIHPEAVNVPAPAGAITAFRVLQWQMGIPLVA